LPEGWEPYNLEKDYCGPEGKWYSALFKRYICGVDCNRCYWAHDQRYRLGETEEDNDFADWMMLTDQYKAVWRAMRIWNPLMLIAFGVATHRYLAVRFKGHDSFYDKHD
jgi:hypothetical protein